MLKLLEKFNIHIKIEELNKLEYCLIVPKDCKIRELKKIKSTDKSLIISDVEEVYLKIEFNSVKEILVGLIKVPSRGLDSWVWLKNLSTESILEILKNYKKDPDQLSKPFRTVFEFESSLEEVYLSRPGFKSYTIGERGNYLDFVKELFSKIKELKPGYLYSDGKLYNFVYLDTVRSLRKKEKYSPASYLYTNNPEEGLDLVIGFYGCVEEISGMTIKEILTKFPYLGKVYPNSIETSGIIAIKSGSFYQISEKSVIKESNSDELDWNVVSKSIFDNTLKEFGLCEDSINKLIFPYTLTNKNKEKIKMSEEDTNLILEYVKRRIKKHILVYKIEDILNKSKSILEDILDDKDLFEEGSIENNSSNLFIVNWLDNNSYCGSFSNLFHDVFNNVVDVIKNWTGEGEKGLYDIINLLEFDVKNNLRDTYSKVINYTDISSTLGNGYLSSTIEKLVGEASDTGGHGIFDISISYRSLTYSNKISYIIYVEDIIKLEKWGEEVPKTLIDEILNSKLLKVEIIN